MAAAAPSWADAPADILITVLRLLPCLADRASVRSVCRHWRASARIEGQALPAPLPVLVLPRFRFSCLTSDGALTIARRAVMPAEVVGDDVMVVGSSDDWLVAVRPRRDGDYRGTDGECLLVNALSGEVLHLPPLRPADYILGTKKPWLRYHSAVLSASPSSGSKYTVAALRFSKEDGKLLGLDLWQPGMTSWYVCQSIRFSTTRDDLAFYQGKLYMVWESKPRIFAFELREDEHGVSLSSPEEYNIDQHPLISSKSSVFMRCNMVVRRGKLLLIIIFFGGCCSHTDYRPYSVEVFALDFNTRPCGFTQIHNFDGDCIFIDTYGCRSFSTGLHLGVQGDLIYFSDEYINDRFLYVYKIQLSVLLPAFLRAAWVFLFGFFLLLELETSYPLLKAEGSCNWWSLSVLICSYVSNTLHIQKH